MVWFSLLVLSIMQVIIIGKVILLENRDPGKTVAWLFILGLLPILGFILYVVFGKKKPGQLFHKKHIPDNRLSKMVHQQQSDSNQEDILPRMNNDSEKKLASLLLNNGFASMTVHNQIEILLNGGEKFQALFNALEGAKHHIHLSYYIFKDDEIGADVLKILSRKATGGVEVRVLLDGMGCLSVSGGFVRSMRQAGIQVEWFFPIRFPFLTSKLNIRYHRKIVVVDGCTGFMGGLNIGDEYLSRDAKLGFWRDTHLKVEGEAVHSLQSIFLNDWFYVTHQEIQGTQYFPQINDFDVLPVQISASGPDSNWASILQGFFNAITMAKHCVYIETPYFVPDESLIMALKTAALCGLDVRLIVQGIPEHKVTFWAMRSYFLELLQAGVKIFQYMKGTLHAKIFLIDNHLASVGSANMDNRSFFIDFEICAFVYDQSLADRLKLDFEQDFKDSSELDLQTFRSRPGLERWKESSARLLSPLL
ncbi:cardiolipin synthase [Desulfosporosinus sp. OT]|uniref:cardiolipin synthase n=1 Tax=Desulfosporosinus sp. OT TaxID=913865 RepID=UPI000223AE1B|nr:cardiolipin synthase [Desulfosporosinus sp. OT]EGW36902.1 phospholipase D family protein [Desulfosporosinus sp. OT]